MTDIHAVVRSNRTLTTKLLKFFKMKAYNEEKRNEIIKDVTEKLSKAVQEKSIDAWFFNWAESDRKDRKDAEKVVNTLLGNRKSTPSTPIFPLRQPSSSRVVRMRRRSRMCAAPSADARKDAFSS